MSTTEPAPRTTGDEPVIALPRRTIDAIAIGVGAVLTVALVVAGALLTWGANFAADYVEDELAAQNIFFPPAEVLEAEGRTDLAQYGGEQVTTGDHAEAYASFIEGHLENIAGGQTYADLGGIEREAAAAIEAAGEEGASEAQLAELEAEAAEVAGQRDSLFKGETLRGLLLTTYAWSTVGQIASYAAIGAFIAAALMLALVIAGIIHYRRTTRDA